MILRILACILNFVEIPAFIEAVKLTYQKKTLIRVRGVFGVAIGSAELYEWLDDNHGV